MRSYFANKKVFSVFKAIHNNQKGEGLVGALITGVILVAILGAIVVAMWPTLTATATSIAGLTQTDAGTDILQAIWPIVGIAIGAGCAVGVVMWILRKMDVI